jgi:hypothetical protein
MDGQYKLTEDNRLNVSTMVHDNKTSETYIENSVERGYYHTSAPNRRLNFVRC